jgi:hypothetical protein
MGIERRSAGVRADIHDQRFLPILGLGSPARDQVIVAPYRREVIVPVLEDLLDDLLVARVRTIHERPIRRCRFCHDFTRVEPTRRSPRRVIAARG